MRVGTQGDEEARRGMNRTEHTNPRGANGPTHICDSFFGKPARLFFCLNRQVRMSYDSSILGPGCSRFMIHESGSMFDLILARLVHSTRPPRDRHATVGNSLLDASARMAKVKVELHPAVAVAIGLVAFPSIVLCVVGCVVGWKRWC